MAMTMKTVMTWDDKPGVAAIETARAAYIKTATAAGDTDGVSVSLGSNTYSRGWSNATTAAAWTDFIQSTAAANGRTVTVVTRAI
jgi:hypothetical protein